MTKVFWLVALAGLCSGMGVGCGSSDEANESRASIGIYGLLPGGTGTVRLGVNESTSNNRFVVALAPNDDGRFAIRAFRVLDKDDDRQYVGRADRGCLTVALPEGVSPSEVRANVVTDFDLPEAESVQREQLQAVATKDCIDIVASIAK